MTKGGAAALDGFRRAGELTVDQDAADDKSEPVLPGDTDRASSSMPLPSESKWQSKCATVAARR